MTAIFALAYADRVEIVSDGAVFGPDGRYVKFASKIHPSPLRPVAVTGLGDLSIIESVGAAVAGVAETVDDALASIRQTFEHTELPPGAAIFDIVLAGISETRGPCIHVMTSRADQAIPRLKLVDAQGIFYGGPTVEEDFLAQFGPFDCGLRRVAVPLMQALRARPEPPIEWPELGPLARVGGFVEHTVVGANGTRIRRLHNWPEDQAGEPIFRG